MKAKRFDQEFDAGKDVTVDPDLSKARRAGIDSKRVNVDFPSWMVRSIDQEATRLGVTRQSSSRCGWRRDWDNRRCLRIDREARTPRALPWH